MSAFQIICVSALVAAAFVLTILALTGNLH